MVFLKKGSVTQGRANDESVTIGSGLTWTGSGQSGRYEEFKVVHRTQVKGHP